MGCNQLIIIYRFSFKFGLDSEINERVLPIDMAISLWRVVFSQRDSSMLQRWINFLEAHPHIRGIPKDTWNMFLNLVDCVSVSSLKPGASRVAYSLIYYL